jgi:hypothetical protein
MKKLVFFVIILLFTRGITYFASGTNSSSQQFDNLLLGYEIGADGNLNQVLAVIVGPKGDAGPAGVAGRNGFIGLNGLDGKDGIDGAPGPIGPSGQAGAQGLQGVAGAQGLQGIQGPAGRNGAPGANGAAGSGGGGAIAMVRLASGDANCPTGGTKFIASDGSQSFACNGSRGDVTFGGGAGTIAVCDDSIDIGMVSHFEPTLARFKLDGIRVSNLSSMCEGDRLDITLSTTAPGGTTLPFVCTVLSLPDALGGDLYLTRTPYTLKYGESGLVVPLVCDPSLSVMDLTILDSILGFQLT